jgi:hypothetical protein
MSLAKHWVLSMVAVVGLLGFSPAAQAGMTYFLVAERPDAKTHGDSFVIGIDKESDIAHARDLIARGPDVAGAPIVFAAVAPGNPGGLNRNLTAPGTPAWDWHVTDVVGFGDMGIELIDGWPTFVQDDIDGWMDNTNGQIGFWSYTVVQELPGYGNAVPLPPAVFGGAVVLAGMAVWRWRARVAG